LIKEVNIKDEEMKDDEVMTYRLKAPVYKYVEGFVDESTDNVDNKRRSDEAVVATVNAVVDTLSVEAEAAVENVNKD
jgi:hypothetical protein